MTECRTNGYFYLSDIQSAIFETNGKISFIPVSTKRPVTPQDLNINVAKEAPVANVIMDGHIMQENLRHTGNDEIWLKKIARTGRFRISRMYSWPLAIATIHLKYM